MFENELMLLLILESVFLIIGHLHIQDLKRKIEMYENILEKPQRPLVIFTQQDDCCSEGEEDEDESDGGFAWFMLLSFIIFVAWCIL